MNKLDKQHQDEHESPVEDLSINEEHDEEVKGGAIAVPNFLVSEYTKR